MWCADCQQDVPAISPSAHEPLMCARCQSQLISAPSDAGIALDSFDGPAQDDLARPLDWLSQEQTRARLREIDRKLSAPRAPQNRQATQNSRQVWDGAFTADFLPLTAPSAPSLALRASARKERAKTSWLLTLLLSFGVMSFCCGVGTLAWSTAFQLPHIWQLGMSLTIGAEGLLILSLTWMAARLWRNGRSVNCQLDGVDQQLARVEKLTGTLAGNQLASSQHYYHHFSQSASPHLLVANLQGQVEQLAARMTAEL